MMLELIHMTSKFLSGVVAGGLNDPKDDLARDTSICIYSSFLFTNLSFMVKFERAGD